jgi:hypothetical protein
VATALTTADARPGDIVGSDPVFRFLARGQKRRESAGRAAFGRVWEIASELFGPAVERGTVKLSRERWDGTEDDPSIAIAPRALDAAAMELAMDGLVLSVAVGPRQWVFEIYAGDPSWEAHLREVMEAVASGGYEERIKPRALGDVQVMSFDTPRGVTSS